MSKAFHSFVVFGGMRTGSNVLEAYLNALEHIRCHGELYNPDFIGNIRQDTFMGIGLKERAENPLMLLDAMRKDTDVLPGFRYFSTHDPRIFSATLHDPRCAKIVLTRNPLDSFLSLKIARKTDQWLTRSIKALKISPKLHFDAQEFRAYFDALSAFHKRIREGLQSTGQSAFFIDYKDIHNPEVLKGLALYLGVNEAPSSQIDLLRQNPQAAQQKVKNPEEMLSALTKIDPFDVAVPAHFESRRPPPLPSFRAARNAPLMYVPIESGIDGAVQRWLEKHFGGLETNFDRTTLHSWYEARPLHRTFCVLQHPVARAHEAFAQHNMDRETLDIDFQIKKVFNIVPLRFRREQITLDSYRDGFIGFIKWLGANLAGQTERQTTSAWASQATVIKSHATLFPPDLIVREERLNAGLQFLCDEVLQHFTPIEPPQHDQMLKRIYNSDVEEAVRSTYAYDYEQFGFKHWGEVPSPKA